MLAGLQIPAGMIHPDGVCRPKWELWTCIRRQTVHSTNRRRRGSRTPLGPKFGYTNYQMRPYVQVGVHRSHTPTSVGARDTLDEDAAPGSRHSSQDCVSDVAPEAVQSAKAGNVTPCAAAKGGAVDISATRADSEDEFREGAPLSCPSRLRSLAGSVWCIWYCNKWLCRQQSLPGYHRTGTGPICQVTKSQGHGQPPHSSDRSE